MPKHSDSKIIGYVGKSVMRTPRHQSTKHKHNVLLGATEITTALINCAATGIYMVQEGKFIYISPLFSEITGYSEQDILGKRSLNLVYPEDRESVRQNAIACLKEQRTNPYEYRFIRKDGKSIWILEKVASVEIKGKKMAVGSFMDITEFKNLAQSSVASEEMNTAIFDASTNPMSMVNSDMSIIYVNRAFQELTGYSWAELVGKRTPFPYWPKEDWNMHSEGLKEAMQQGLWKKESRFLKKDGSEFWVQLSGSIIGDKKIFLSVWVDITERKMAEQSLKEERDRAQKYLDVASVIMLVLDTDGRVKMINNKGCQILELEEQEIIGKNWFDNFLPVRFRDTVRKVFGDMLNGSVIEDREIENPVLTIDGTEKIISWRNTVLFDDKGQLTGILSSGADITDRLRAEQLLIESERKYRTLTDSSLTGIYINQDGRYVFVNDRFAEMHGYRPEELIGKNYLQLIYPPDHEIAKQRALQFSKTRMYPRETETRRLRKDGSIIYCQMIAQSITYSGKPAVMGNLIDITERKRMEEDLRLKAQLLDEATDSIIVHNLEGKIIYTNKVAHKVRGYTREELMNINFLELIEPRQRWLFGDQLQELFNNKRVIFVADNICKDHSLIPMETHSCLIGTATRKLIISVSHDITDRKKAENELLFTATHDSLTGLPNRGLLNDRMYVALANAQRNNNKMAVVMLDLDYFKNINDEFGHSIGDKLLKQTGDRLVKLIRKGDTVARVGGDEFLMLLLGIKSLNDVNGIAQKIIAAFQEPFVLNDYQVKITASLGIAMYPDDGTDVDTLTGNADNAMYRAKAKGRNDYEVYSLRR